MLANAILIIISTILKAKGENLAVKAKIVPMTAPKTSHGTSFLTNHRTNDGDLLLILMTERQAQLPRARVELLWWREWKDWTVVKSGVWRLGVSCSVLLALYLVRVVGLNMIYLGLDTFRNRELSVQSKI